MFYRKVLHPGDVLVHPQPSGASLFSAPPVSTARSRGPVYSPRGQEESQKVKASGIAPTARETTPAVRPPLSTRVSSPTTSASPDARPPKLSRASPPQQPSVPARPSPPLPNPSTSSSVSPAARPPMPATSSPKRPPMPPTPSPKHPPAPRQGTTRPVAIPVPQEMKGAFPKGHMICQAQATSNIHKEDLSSYTHKFSSKEQMLKDMQDAVQKGHKVYAIVRVKPQEAPILSAIEIQAVKQIQTDAIKCIIESIRDTFLEEIARPKKAIEKPEHIVILDAEGKSLPGYIRPELLMKIENLKLAKFDIKKDTLEYALFIYLRNWVSYHMILDTKKACKSNSYSSLQSIIDRIEKITEREKRIWDSQFIINECYMMAKTLLDAEDMKPLLIKSFKDILMWSNPVVK